MPSITISLTPSEYDAIGRTSKRLAITTSSGRSNVRETARQLVQAGIQPDMKPAKKKGGKPA